MSARPTLPTGLRAPRSGDAAEDRARAEQTADLSGVLGAPLLRAVKVGRIKVTAAKDLQVAHKLGRELVGWLASRPDSTSGVREVKADRDTLTLRSPGDITFDLWVW